MQYVLIELFRNVFLEKIMMEIIFPIDPMAITITLITVIAKVKDASDIFIDFFFYFLFLFLLNVSDFDYFFSEIGHTVCIDVN